MKMIQGALLVFNISSLTKKESHRWKKVKEWKTVKRREKARNKQAWPGLRGCAESAWMYERLANSIQCSKAVTHPSTDRAHRCLTWVIVWSLVRSILYGRWRKIESAGENLNALPKISNFSISIMTRISGRSGTKNSLHYPNSGIWHQI